jgi:hypothetical protein
MELSMKRLGLAIVAAVLTVSFFTVNTAHAATKPDPLTKMTFFLNGSTTTAAYGVCMSPDVYGAGSGIRITAMSLTEVAENANGSNRRVLDTQVISDPAGRLAMGLQTKTFTFPTKSLPKGSRVAIAQACTYKITTASGTTYGVSQNSAGPVVL